MSDALRSAARSSAPSVDLYQEVHATTDRGQRHRFGVQVPASSAGGRFTGQRDDVVAGAVGDAIVQVFQQQLFAFTGCRCPLGKTHMPIGRIEARMRQMATPQS